MQVGVYTGVWEGKKPPQGTELNKPALVTMYNVLPEGATSSASLTPHAVAQFTSDLREFSECVPTPLCALARPSARSSPSARTFVPHASASVWPGLTSRAQVPGYDVCVL